MNKKDAIQFFTFLSKWYHIMVIFFFILLVATVIYSFSSLSSVEVEECDTLNPGSVVVRGTSLAPYIVSGQTLPVLYGYYECYKPTRGDIVLYEYSGNVNPLIKIIAGVEGDKIAFLSEDGVHKIVLNNKVLKNVEGEEYVLSQRALQVLSPYIKDYNGSIPPGAVFLLSNTVEDAIDSRRFGFVSVAEIIAKIDL